MVHGGELDDIQLYFVQWINFYRMFSELPLADAPDREIIEDDERCDRWYDAYFRQITSQAKAHGSNYVPVQSDWHVPTFGE